MPPTNLFGLGYGVGPAGYGYPSAGRWSPLSLGYSQFAARLATSPTLARAQAYDRMIYALEQAGIWSKFDALYILAAADGATARTNLISSSYGLTAVGSPTFTADVGYTTADGKYLRTGFNPSTAGGQFARNSAHVSVWPLEVDANDGVVFGFLGQNDLGVNITALRTGAGAGASDARRQGYLNAVGAIGDGYYTDGSGMHLYVRPDSANLIGYKNGDEQSFTDANASAALVNDEFTIGRGWPPEPYGPPDFPLRYYPGKIAMASFGSKLTAGESLSFYKALRSFLTGGLTIVAHGDSITNGYGLTRQHVSEYAFPDLVARSRYQNAGTICLPINRGINGASWNYDYGGGTLIDDAPTNIDIHVSANARLVLFAGTNGLWSTLGNHSAATEYANFQTYIAARIAAGWNPDHIVVVTCLPREGGFTGTRRADYNALLVGGASTYGYRLARVDQNSTIGDDGDEANTTYYGDLIHPTQAGHTIIASIIYTAMFA